MHSFGNFEYCGRELPSDPVGRSNKILDTFVQRHQLASPGHVSTRTAAAEDASPGRQVDEQGESSATYYQD